MACLACEKESEDQYGKVNILKFDSKRDIIPPDPNLPNSLPVTEQRVPRNDVPVSTIDKSKLSLPSLKEMAFSFTSTLKDAVVKAAHEGTVLAGNMTLAKRMDTCTKCEFLIHESSRCSKCGCFMNYKVRLAASKCPLNKW